MLTLWGMARPLLTESPAEISLVQVGPSDRAKPKSRTASVSGRSPSRAASRSVAATAASAAGAAGAATAARAAGALTSLPSAVGADRAALAAVEAFLPPNIEGRPPKFTPRTSFPGTVDPARLAQALGEAIGRTLVQPSTCTALLGRHAQGVGQALFATAGRLVGHKPDGPMTPAPRDTRFASDTWQNNPLYFGLMQAYLLHRDLLGEFVAAADLPGPSGQGGNGRGTAR